ncbi:hypothetical protein [Collinsella sp. TM09-10AT]|uniref:hypothetical protein n=1 Tax=Collinsella sp. TM09-10AT TaxID=2292343 RepID=UPI001314480C|nr:hypothetical protein [Collinsella sp. TM09-10AT]
MTEIEVIFPCHIPQWMMSPAEHLAIYVFVLKVHLSQLSSLIPALGSILIGHVLKQAAVKAGESCVKLEL